jgi:protoporphyrinogen oxidase
MARRYYYPGCHKLEPYLSEYPVLPGELKVTENVAESILCLPCYPDLGKENVEKISQIIIDTYNNKDKIAEYYKKNPHEPGFNILKERKMVENRVKPKFLDKKMVVLGSGVSGLCAGWNLADFEKDVEILEKEHYPGGLSYTYKDGAYLFDMGPHFIHTGKKDILHYLKKILGEDLVHRKPKVKIFFNDQYVDYPLKGIRVLKVLSKWKALLTLVNFVYARLSMFLRTPKTEKDNSFRAWIVNRFGKMLYNIYFGPYAEKAWKIPDKEISKYVAERRVAIISITDYLRKFLNLEQKYNHPEDAKLDVYYPKYGIGQIVEYLEKSFQEKGGKIQLGSNITEIRRNGQRIESVKYEQNGVEKNLCLDFLFSTIPINKFIELIKPLPPQDVLEAAKKIDYCAERILYIKVNKPKIFDSSIVYFQSPDVKFNRIYDIGHYSPECLPEGKGAICIEFTCSYNDDIWNSSDEQLFNYAADILVSHGILDKRDVEGYITKHIAHAYPRFRIGFQDNLKKIFAYLNEIENVISFGRQGLFCYANVDESLDMGFKAAEFLNAMSWKGIDYYSLFDEYVHF